MADLGDLGRGAASWSPPPRPQPESALARQVNENAKKDLKEGLLLYNSENNVGLKNAWNIIQAEMHCCGVTDYRDWFSVLGENTVPDRCCMENSQGCGQNNTTPVWKTGCYEKVKQWFADNKHVLGTGLRPPPRACPSLLTSP
ncbi:hypothetical protein Celaphus_00013871 [Cervus elaphus hippelaphus]|uniref:Tetraspanin-9 n=1 Tax=Cervus elaphus hippelaphus TaxID=46360 RepID=A0A212CDB2_CEREH|nr:hypothetical protein Celaphus_00013871 [Cervus elaphus hippelaphus]